MKLFRKISNCILALTLGIGIIPMNNQKVAATNICGDVNNDGYVDVTDVTGLSHYLSANFSSINLKNADVDRNSSIDINDVKSIQAYLSHSITSLPTREGFNNATYNFPADESRSYTKYTRATSSTSMYTLSSNSSSSAMSRMPFVDDRVLDTSSDDLCAIVQIQSNHGNGSGFIISDHIIATAAHCVYDGTTNCFDPSVYITFYSQGTAMIGGIRSSEIIEFHVPTRYITDNANITDPNLLICDYDYALIYTERDLSQFGKINLGMVSNYFITTSSVVGISGFPLEIYGNPINPKRYRSEGMIRNSNNNNIFLGSTAYVSEGNSGGPLYIQYQLNGNRYRAAIGILSCTDDHNTPDTELDDYSKSIRVTKPVLRFYNNNNYIGA